MEDGYDRLSLLGGSFERGAGECRSLLPIMIATKTGFSLARLCSTHLRSSPLHWSIRPVDCRTLGRTGSVRENKE